jgi:hypothetical protein
MTVQRAIEILESNGLDPFKYAFICHDKWSEDGKDVDKYGFRIDQLNMFIAAGINYRLNRIEGIVLDSK